MSPLLSIEEQRAAESAPTFSLIPEGIYICRVAGVDRWSAGIGEDPQGKSLRWIFRIVKGQPYEGRDLWTWTSLKAESIGRTKQYLAALGFGLDASSDEILTTPCKVAVTVETRTGTGEPSNKVKRIFAYDGPELPREFDPDDGGREFLSDDEALI